jgi:RNA polymerase sigma-70 factor (ECF subfamily)
VLATDRRAHDNPRVESPASTVWTVIRHAAEGVASARASFAETYLPVVRAYLAARWRGTSLIDEVDDATQEVFVDFFKEGGALTRLRADEPGGFRAFLFGVVRNAALHAETRRRRRGGRVEGGSPEVERIAGDEESASHAFDRAWAVAMVHQARRLQGERASSAGEEAVRRTEILRLRFQEGLPIRDIATAWGVDAAAVHYQYARARKEFAAALREVVAEHHPGTDAEIDERCESLLALLR